MSSTWASLAKGSKGIAQKCLEVREAAVNSLADERQSQLLPLSGNVDKEPKAQLPRALSTGS